MMKTNIKQISLIILLLVLSILIAGCSQSKNRAEEHVKSYIEEFKAIDPSDESGKNSDAAEIRKYFSDPALAQQVGDQFGMLMLEVIIDSLKYEVISSEKINDTKVSVKTKVVAIDMRKVINNYYLNMATFVASNPKYAKMTPKQMEKESQNIMQESFELFKQSMSKENRALITQNIDVIVNVPKDEKAECEIENSDELMDIMCGGLMSWADEATKTLDELQKKNGNKPIL